MGITSNRITRPRKPSTHFSSGKASIEDFHLGGILPFTIWAENILRWTLSWEDGGNFGLTTPVIRFFFATWSRSRPYLRAWSGIRWWKGGWLVRWARRSNRTASLGVKKLQPGAFGRVPAWVKLRPLKGRWKERKCFVFFSNLTGTRAPKNQFHAKKKN